MVDGGSSDHEGVEPVLSRWNHRQVFRLDAEQPCVEGVMVIAAEDKAVAHIETAFCLYGDQVCGLQKLLSAHAAHSAGCAVPPKHPKAEALLIRSGLYGPRPA